MSKATKQLTTCPKKTAVAYARYSSAKQRDVSIEQQLRDIHAYAEREGYTIVREYADHARSGFKRSDQRLEFQKMLIDASSGVFDTVIAWKVDRFGRDRRESAMYKGQLADAGVSVVYAMEPIPDGAAGVLTEGMLEAIAEWYSRNLSENVKRGHHDNALKCLSNGHIPLGYKTGPDNYFAIDEEKAPIVRRIFNMYAEGHSLMSICDTLNNEGIRTKTGCTFSKTPLASIITNEAYIGVYHYGDVRIPGGMPAIIDQDLFDICQEQRRKTSRHFERSPEGYLLTGKVFCGFCGTKMYGAYGQSGNKKSGYNQRYYYYVCNKRKRAQRFCNDSKFVRRDAIEKPIIRFLMEKVLTGDKLDAFIEMAVNANDQIKKESPLQQLEKEYKDVIRRINNITYAISDGIWTKQTAALLEELNNRADSLKCEISNCNFTENKRIDEERYRFLMYKFANGDLKNRDFLRTMLSTLINSVTVYDNWMRVVINMAENVEMIPPDDLPGLSEIPDGSKFELSNVSQDQHYAFEQYPVIVFKMAI